MPTPRTLAILSLALLPVFAGCATPTAQAPPDELGLVREATAAWKMPEAAEAAGYSRYSRYIDHHGVHYRNLAFATSGFDLLKPPVLSYIMLEDGSLTLGAVEYSIPRTTNVPPEGFAGSDDVWGVHEASCHYEDGKSFAEKVESACPPIHPESSAPVLLWHPDQWTLHAWIHIENPAGTFKPANPNVR